MTPIPPVNPAAQSLASQPVSMKPANASGGDNSIFESFLNKTNVDQKTSDQAIKDLVEGKAESVQQVVLAVAEAEMSFQMFMEIRNKLIDTYNELMRMQF